MNKTIPDDLILMLSGVQCVGKTTTAYNLIRYVPEFRRVSEIDIIRTVIRAVVRSLKIERQADTVYIQNKYCALFKSIADNDLDTAKQQSMLLIPYVREIVQRQQRRKIPTIIEGSSIVPTTYFDRGIPIDGFNKNVVFINLFLSNKKEHYNRRRKRCMERQYDLSGKEIINKIETIRNNKNLMLHRETLELGKTVNNVFSIDVSNMNEDELVSTIVQRIKVMQSNNHLG